MAFIVDKVSEDSFYNNLLMGLLKILHKTPGVTKTRVRRFPGCSHGDICAWEQKNGVILPEDIRSFYLATDGFLLSWSYLFPDNEVRPVGDIRVNTLSKFNIQFGVSTSQSAEVHVENRRFVLQLGPESKVFEIQALEDNAKILLIYLNKKYDPTIWLGDTFGHFYYMACNFTCFVRMCVAHLGIPLWPYSITPYGNVPDWVEHIFLVMAPHLLPLGRQIEDIKDDGSKSDEKYSEFPVNRIDLNIFRIKVQRNAKKVREPVWNPASKINLPVYPISNNDYAFSKLLPDDWQVIHICKSKSAIRKSKRQEQRDAVKRLAAYRNKNQTSDKQPNPVPAIMPKSPQRSPRARLSIPPLITFVKEDGTLCTRQQTASVQQDKGDSSASPPPQEPSAPRTDQKPADLLMVKRKKQAMEQIRERLRKYLSKFEDLESLVKIEDDSSIAATEASVMQQLQLQFEHSKRRDANAAAKGDKTTAANIFQRFTAEEIRQKIRKHMSTYENVGSLVTFVDDAREEDPDEEMIRLMVLTDIFQERARQMLSDENKNAPTCQGLFPARVDQSTSNSVLKPAQKPSTPLKRSPKVLELPTLCKLKETKYVEQEVVKKPIADRPHKKMMPLEPKRKASSAKVQKSATPEILSPKEELDELLNELRTGNKKKTLSGKKQPASQESSRKTPNKATSRKEPTKELPRRAQTFLRKNPYDLQIKPYVRRARSPEIPKRSPYPRLESGHKTSVPTAPNNTPQENYSPRSAPLSRDSDTCIRDTHFGAMSPKYKNPINAPKPKNIRPTTSAVNTRIINSPYAKNWGKKPTSIARTTTSTDKTPKADSFSKTMGTAPNVNRATISSNAKLLTNPMATSRITPGQSPRMFGSNAGSATTSPNVTSKLTNSQVKNRLYSSNAASMVTSPHVTSRLTNSEVRNRLYGSNVPSTMASPNVTSRLTNSEAKNKIYSSNFPTMMASPDATSRMTNLETKYRLFPADPPTVMTSPNVSNLMTSPRMTSKYGSSAIRNLNQRNNSSNITSRVTSPKPRNRTTSPTAGRHWGTSPNLNKRTASPNARSRKDSPTGRKVKSSRLKKKDSQMITFDPSDPDLPEKLRQPPAGWSPPNRVPYLEYSLSSPVPMISPFHSNEHSPRKHRKPKKPKAVTPSPSPPPSPVKKPAPRNFSGFTRWKPNEVPEKFVSHTPLYRTANPRRRDVHEMPQTPSVKSPTPVNNYNNYSRRSPREVKDPIIPKFVRPSKSPYEVPNYKKQTKKEQPKKQTKSQKTTYDNEYETLCTMQALASVPDGSNKVEVWLPRATCSKVSYSESQLTSECTSRSNNNML